MNLIESLKNPALDLQCPDCGTTLRFTLADLKEKRVLTCACGNEVALEEEAKSSQKLMKAAQDMEVAMKKLGLE
jgi:hypothetical protein